MGGGNGKAENLKDCLGKGSFLGMALICSSLLALSIQRNSQAALAGLPFFPAVLAGYLGLGVLLCWIHTRPAKRREASRGMGMIYWYGILFALIAFGAQLVPQAWRGPALANLALLALLWGADYVYLWKVARELNSGIVGKPFTLVEDLDQKPRDTEAFLEQIARYCAKNRIHLEIITREKPILVRMDGILYRASLRFYYSRYGTPVYTMEFTTETEGGDE